MEQKTSVKNIVLALLLSLLVMVAGGVVWGLCYAANFFSAWVSLLFSFLAMLVYTKFNKEGKWYMFAYVLVLSIIINYFAMCISATFVGLASANVSTSYFGTVFPEALKISFGQGVSDTILCFVFTLLGCGLGIVAVISENKRNAALEKYAAETGADLSKMNRAQKNKVASEWMRKTSSKSAASAQVQQEAKEEKVDAGVLYGEILEEISVILAAKKDLTKEVFDEKLASYKANRIDVLSAETREQLASLSAEVLDQAKMEQARKVFVKLMK